MARDKREEQSEGQAPQGAQDSGHGCSAAEPVDDGNKYLTPPRRGGGSVRRCKSSIEDVTFVELDPMRPQQPQQLTLEIFLRLVLRLFGDVVLYRLFLRFAD